MATIRLDQIVGLSRAVLDRLERGDRLSEVLSQARVVAQLSDERKHVRWLDFEIYGVGDVPGQKTPLQTAEERDGFNIFWNLHAVQDPRGVTLDGVIESWEKREEPDNEKDSLDPNSVADIERSIEAYREPDDHFQASKPDTALQFRLTYLSKRNILQRVRDYLHAFISDVWISKTDEKENIKLLGPDYRLVVHNLDALATGVGQELLAALGLLRSTNPADWSAAAVVCRNVILKLGRTLFPLVADNYDSALAGRTLDLTGEKEKNRLCAFIDCHWRDADGTGKRELERLDQLARRIYDEASRGKRGTELRHAEAQQLVVDAYELVSSLGGLVGLEPVEPQLSDPG